MPSADDGIFFYQLERASRDDLDRALTAVRASFDEAGADPAECAAAAFRIEGGHRATPRQRRLAGLWFGALPVANIAACGHPDPAGRISGFGLKAPMLRARRERPSEFLLPHYELIPIDIDDEIPW